jgi:hypothetical protein
MADKKLFEQPIEVPENQGMENRIAFGRSGVATKNMTFNNLVSWLNGKLSFLKPSSNLNDVANKASARNNLNVYSKDETYNKSEVDYQVNQMDNKFGGASIIGGVHCGYDSDGNKTVTVLFGAINVTTANFNRISQGRYELVHNFGHYGYMVIGQVVGGWSGSLQNKIAEVDRAANLIQFNVGDDNTPNDLVNSQGVFLLFIGF